MDILRASHKKYHYKIDPHKAKPFVRRGQKAAGLLGRKMAELPKDKSSGSSPFRFNLKSKMGCLVERR
jgi:hypothetical protein